MMNSRQHSSLLTGVSTAIFALLMGAAVSAFATQPTKSTPKPPAPKPQATKPATPAKPGTTKPGGATTTGSGSGAGKITTGGSHPTTTTGKPGEPAGAGGKGPNAAGHSAVPGYGRTPKGVTSHPLKSGASYTTRAGGKPAGFHDSSKGIDTHHGLNGGYHGSVMHADHSGVSFSKGRAGYVQRPYSYHGASFVSRSYYFHGHASYGFYNGYGWRGGYYNVYAPGFFFGAGFYGWAYNPWYAPITFGFGWGGAPWYGFYGGWFTPYPTYASPAFWLTDYLISQNLQAAYAAHQEGGEQAVAGGSGVMLTPEVKEQIAAEVRNQIALENQEAQQTAAGQVADPGSSGIARMVTDGKQHIFVAASALDVVDAASGQECALSDGDVIQLATPPAADATTADLVVLASKGGNECQKTATVTVNFSDLQEMQNSMRQNLDNGLKELQAKQGTGGIPAAPPSAKAAPTQAPYAAVAPPPAPNDEQQIQQQQDASQQAEQQASQEAGATGQQ